MKSFGVSIALLWVVIACTNMGLQSPTTFDDKLAYAYGVHTAVLDTAAIEVDNKTLTPSDGNTVLKLADQSRTLLDSARVLSATDPKTANGKLILASQILTQLQTYLKKEQQK